MVFYLSGGFYGDWQARLQRECKLLKSYNPETETEGIALFEFVDGDLDSIRAVDGVIAHWDTYPDVAGTMAEIGYAVAVGTPVLLILDGVTVPNPFILGLARRVFVGMDAFITWWNDRVKRYKPVV
jgi:hypothetical protein